MNLSIYLPAALGLITMLSKKLGSRYFSVVFGIITMLLLLPTGEKITDLSLHFLIILFLVWSWLNTKVDYLDRAAALFGLFGGLISVCLGDMLGILIGLSTLSVSTIGILFKDYNWSESGKYALNYLIFSALGISIIVISFIFGADLKDFSLVNSSKMAQIIFFTGLLIKLGLPVINPTGYSLYFEVLDGSRLSFWTNFYKFAIFSVICGIISKAPELNEFIRLASVPSAFIGFGLIAYSTSVRSLFAGSSFFTFSVLIYFASIANPVICLLLAFIYSLAGMIAFRSVNGADDVQHPWLVGISLIIMGGVAPIFLITLIKILILTVSNITYPLIPGLLALSLFSVSYFYLKIASDMFEKPNPKLPRESVSLVFLILILNVIIIKSPSLLLKLLKLV